MTRSETPGASRLAPPMARHDDASARPAKSSRHDEVREEAGLELREQRLLAVVMRRQETQDSDRAQIVGGQFGSGMEPEMLGRYSPERGTYTPVWMLLDRICSIMGRPKQFFDVVARFPTDGWPDAPLYIVDHGSSPEAGDRQGA